MRLMKEFPSRLRRYQTPAQQLWLTLRRVICRIILRIMPKVARQELPTARSQAMKQPQMAERARMSREIRLRKLGIRPAVKRPAVIRRMAKRARQPRMVTHRLKLQKPIRTATDRLLTIRQTRILMRRRTILATGQMQAARTERKRLTAKRSRQMRRMERQERNLAQRPLELQVPGRAPVRPM